MQAENPRCVSMSKANGSHLDGKLIQFKYPKHTRHWGGTICLAIRPKKIFPPEPRDKMKFEKERTAKESDTGYSVRRMIQEDCVLSGAFLILLPSSHHVSVLTALWYLL